MHASAKTRSLVSGAIAALAIFACGAAGGLLGVRDARLSASPGPAPVFARAVYAKTFYEEAFDWARQHPADRVDAAALTVNHHLLAKHLIARTLLAESRTPNRVIVISPDHFSRGAGDVTVANADYDTVYGLAETDHALVRLLTEQHAATIGNEVMSNEHGIHNVMPFIKAAYPDAKVIGIMVKSDARDVSELVRALESQLGKDDLVVASLDFSHYLTGSTAQFHDRMAMSVLRSADDKGADLMDIDCRACLHVLFALTAAQHAQRFTLFDETSSAALVGFDKADESTSYVNGAFVAGEPEAEGMATALLLPMRRKTIGAAEFTAMLNPEHERRFFYGQDMVLGWPGAPDASLVRDYGMRDATLAPKDEIIRGVTMRYGADARGGVTLTCGGETVTYAIGGEPGLHRTKDGLVFNRPQALELDAQYGYPALALGVVCSASGVDVYPFFLEKNGNKIALDSFMASQASSKRYLNLDDFHLEYPNPQ